MAIWDSNRNGLSAWQKYREVAVTPQWRVGLVTFLGAVAGRYACRAQYHTVNMRQVSTCELQAIA